MNKLMAGSEPGKGWTLDWKGLCLLYGLLVCLVLLFGVYLPWAFVLVGTEAVLCVLVAIIFGRVK